MSVDSHVDMSWLPGDLFVENAPQHLKNKVPLILDTRDGPAWVAEDNILGVTNSAGHGFKAPTRGNRKRTDRMLDFGFYDGLPHPTDPELQLKDMSLDGVDGEIIYGITGTGMRLKAHETIGWLFKIYNDWAANSCKTYPGRWYALSCIPVHNPKLAAEEVQRSAGLGTIRGADLIASEVTWPIYSRDDYWDLLWQALAETGMPISFHVGGGRIPVPVPAEGALATQIAS